MLYLFYVSFDSVEPLRQILIFGGLAPFIIEYIELFLFILLLFVILLFF